MTLEAKFKEITRLHIKFVNNRPESLSIEGDNLVSNGYFHMLWLSILKKNKFVNKKVLLPFYYDKYSYLVNKEKEAFEKNFDFCDKFKEGQP